LSAKSTLKLSQQASSGQKVARMPELILGNQSSLEIEMDRFLAKKNLTFKSDEEESISIIKLLLKSWYSLARLNSFTVEGV